MCICINTWVQPAHPGECSLCVWLQGWELSNWMTNIFTSRWAEEFDGKPLSCLNTVDRKYQLFTEVFYIDVSWGRLIDKPLILSIYCFSLPHFTQGSWVCGSSDLTSQEALWAGTTMAACGSPFVYMYPVFRVSGEEHRSPDSEFGDMRK